MLKAKLKAKLHSKQTPSNATAAALAGAAAHATFDEKMSFPNFLLFVWVNGDGNGDLIHWIDHDVFLTKQPSGEYRPFRVVVIDDSRVQLCKGKLLDHGYKVTVLQNDEHNFKIVPGNPQDKMVYLVVAERMKTAMKFFMAGKKNLTWIELMEFAFIQNFCNKTDRRLLSCIENFVFVSMTPFNKDEKEGQLMARETGKQIIANLDLQKLKPYFPKAQWIALPEHADSTVLPAGVTALRMGFGEDEYGIKFKPARAFTSVDATLAAISHQKLAGVIGKAIKNTQAVLFIPVYIKSTDAMFIFMQSILMSSLVTQQTTVVFYLTGCDTFNLAELEKIRGRLKCAISFSTQFVAPATAFKKGKRCYILQGWDANEKDYEHILALGNALGGIGGCGGDTSFERIESLMMVAFYDLPHSKDKLALIKKLRVYASPTMETFLGNLMAMANTLHNDASQAEKDKIYKQLLLAFPILLSPQLIAEWKKVINMLSMPFNYYSHLVGFFAPRVPKLFAAADLKEAAMAETTRMNVIERYQKPYNALVTSVSEVFAETFVTNYIWPYASPIEIQEVDTQETNTQPKSSL